MRLLLVSNSQCFGHQYLEHAEQAVKDQFDGLDGNGIAFVPFAVHDQRAYGQRVGARFNDLGLSVTTVTPDEKGVALLSRSGGIFVGGGNTFRLLNLLRRHNMVSLIQKRVRAGTPYMGSSAGSGIAAPTIKTSNDMPIVAPQDLGGLGFESLGLVDYQLNLHYIDTDPDSTHMGETRQQRLEEYLEDNQTPVVALREGAWIEVAGEVHRVGGQTGGLVFQRGGEPKPLVAGDELRWSNALTLEVIR